MYTKIIQNKNDCWYNIQYPRHNATIHLTYKTLNANLGNITEESHVRIRPRSSIRRNY